MVRSVPSWGTIFDIMNEEKRSVICAWIGGGECCRHPTMYGKSYCEVHHDRMYTTMLPEMANYIIEKELKEVLQKPIDS